MAAGTQDVFETSSFSSLILQEEIQEIIPLDLHAACLIGDTETVNGKFLMLCMVKMPLLVPSTSSFLVFPYLFLSRFDDILM